MQQIRNWLNNHIDHARNGTVPTYNGPPDDLTVTRVRGALPRPRPSDPDPDANIMALAVQHFETKTQAPAKTYTLPDYKAYQNIFWWKIGAVINEAYSQYLRTTLPDGQQHKKPLPFRNEMARMLFEKEKDEVKLMVNLARKGLQPEDADVVDEDEEAGEPGNER